MKMQGTDGVTPWFMLAESGFKEGALTKLIKTSEVGTVYKIYMEKP